MRFISPEPETLVPEILVRSGFKRPGQADATMRNRAVEAARRAIAVSAPKSSLSMHSSIDVEERTIRVSSVVLQSAKLSHLARRSLGPFRICVFFLTLGSSFDDATETLKGSSLLEQLFLDAAGSVLVERHADRVEEEVKRLCAEEGLESSLRFSPGYCDWDTGEGQRALFSLGKPSSAGISMREPGMMVPKKSVSAILLAARRLHGKTPCLLCALDDCRYRRVDPV